MNTKVVNLANPNEEFLFSIPAVQAVNACYEQEVNRNYNTWDYGKTIHMVEISNSGKTAYRGNYAALIKGE